MRSYQYAINITDPEVLENLRAFVERNRGRQ